MRHATRDLGGWDMRQRVEVTIMRPPGEVFDFVARDHWRNHPRWDPNVVEMIPLEAGQIRAGSRARVRRTRGSGDEGLTLLAFEPGSRWGGPTQIGQNGRASGRGRVEISV